MNKKNKVLGSHTPSKYIAAVDIRTGEYVTESYYIQTVEDRELQKERMKEIAKRKNSRLGYGTFYFLFWDEIFFELKLSSFARLLCLATYISYDKNNIDIDKAKDKLSIKGDTFNDFIKECNDLKLLSVNKDREIVLSNQFFYRGKINKARAKMRFVKVNIKNLQKLYFDCITHKLNLKLIGYLFRCIPYANKQYNILCKNTKELNKEYIKPINRDIFCDICDYNVSNFARLRKNFLNLSVYSFDNKTTEPVITFNDCNGQLKIIIHPLIYYGGTDYKNALASARLKCIKE